MQVDLLVFNRQMAAFEDAIAKSGTSACDRFQIFKDYDPYGSIPPALLGAGPLASYAMTTGMIEPFERSQLTKPATYLVKVEGECRYRDEDGKLVSFYLSRDPAARARHLDVRARVRLAPNSVCFLTLAPEFRMPAYIAARFNLLIRDVYRGLLVGTGPLVDPGFVGRLSIPIHNFTNREYFIDAGEGLVYFEFTKLTWSNPSQSPPLPLRVPHPIGDQPPFPASKANRKTLDDYLNAATGSGPPASAIGHTMKKLKKEARRAKALLGAYSLGGLIAAIALLYTTWSAYVGTQQFTASAQSELREGRAKISDELNKIRTKQDELERLIKATQATSAPQPPGGSDVSQGPPRNPTAPQTK
jgi:deoxycytidine triphosphate deaminase